MSSGAANDGWLSRTRGALSLPIEGWLPRYMVDKQHGVSGYV